MVSGVSKLWDPGIALEASLVILSSSVHDQNVSRRSFQKKRSRSWHQLILSKYIIFLQELI